MSVNIVVCHASFILICVVEVVAFPFMEEIEKKKDFGGPSPGKTEFSRTSSRERKI